MRGLTLRVTNISTAPQPIPDLPRQSAWAPGEVRELYYTDDVQISLESGSINALLIGGKLAARFVSGTNLSQAPIGRMFTGATPTLEGVRGLVPTTSPTERTFFLRGDGTWAGITPFSIGAVPESLLTQQGDLLVRGVTTGERLPSGNLGEALRVGLIGPQWQDTSLADVLANRPAPSAYYAGVFYWATDTLDLYVCYDTGSGYAWKDTSAAGNITINTTAPLTGGGVGVLFTLGVSVGTVAGTVAAGDDPRIVNAVPNTRTLTGSSPITVAGDNLPHNLSANRTVGFAVPGETNGDLFARLGGLWTRLPVGAPGDVLTVAGALPVWAPPGATPLVVSCPGTVAVGDVVYITGSNTVDQASAGSLATIPVVAFVSAKPTAVTAVLHLHGPLGGFVGLTPGAGYFVSIVPGGMTATVNSYVPGNVVQRVGTALTSTTLLVSISPDYTEL